jgi:hypothetical protein
VVVAGDGTEHGGVHQFLPGQDETRLSRKWGVIGGEKEGGRRRRGEGFSGYEMATGHVSVSLEISFFYCCVVFLLVLVSPVSLFVRKHTYRRGLIERENSCVVM